jgi:hypothetical protein
MIIKRRNIHMSEDIISKYFENSRAVLRVEHDSMVKKIKDEIDKMKNKALSKVPK